MKSILLYILLITSCANIYGQGFTIGFYNDNHNSSIKFEEDSTFFYQYRFHHGSAEAYGKWTMHLDTIILNQVIVYDILIYDDTVGYLFDEPIVEYNKISRFQSKDFKIDTIYNIFSVLPFLAAIYPLADFKTKKYLYKKDRLYKLDDNGKVVRKKYKNYDGGKKYHDYYIKTANIK